MTTRKTLRRRIHRRPTHAIDPATLSKLVPPRRRWRLVMTACVLAMLPLGAVMAAPVAHQPSQVAPFSDDAQLAIAKARTALAGALAVGAEAYAPGAVAATRDRIATAERWHAAGRDIDAIAQARLALKAGIEARVTARPLWMEAQALQARAEQRRALVRALTERTMTTPRVDGSEVEVPVYGAFEPRTAQLSADGRARLGAIADIARAHDDYRVTIAAQPAQALPPTDALLTGQSRAQRASDWLEAYGVEPARVRTGPIEDEAGRHLIVRFEARGG